MSKSLKNTEQKLSDREKSLEIYSKQWGELENLQNNINNMKVMMERLIGAMGMAEQLFGFTRKDVELNKK